MIKCSVCGKKFDSIHAMTNHRRWHNLPEYKKFQENFKKKISIANKDINNGMWKGNDVKIDALHNWVKRNKFKPKLCEICNQKKKLELANISEEYKRDINDYKWLCRSCHSKKHRGNKEWGIFIKKYKGVGD